MRHTLIASLLLVTTVSLLTGCRSGASSFAFWKRDTGQPPETTGLLASTTPTLPSAQVTPPATAQSSVTQSIPTSQQWTGAGSPGTVAASQVQSGPYQVDTQTAQAAGQPTHGMTASPSGTAYPLNASLAAAQPAATGPALPGSAEVRVPGTSAAIGGSRYPSGSPYDTASASQPMARPQTVYPPTGTPAGSITPGSHVQQAAAALTADARAGIGAVHNQVSGAVQQPVQQVAADWNAGTTAPAVPGTPAASGNQFRPGGTSDFPPTMSTSAPGGTYPSTGL